MPSLSDYKIPYEVALRSPLTTNTLTEKARLQYTLDIVECITPSPFHLYQSYIALNAMSSGVLSFLGLIAAASGQSALPIDFDFDAAAIPSRLN